jgi:hypothetical protein
MTREEDGMIKRGTATAIALGLVVCSLSASAEESAEPAEPPPEVPVGTVDLGERVDLVLITSDDLAEAWQAFSRWKTRTGRPTKVVSLSEIEDQFEGDDIQQKIRACCLKYVDEQGTRFIVLGGDSGQGASGVVPDRDTHHSDFYKYENIPTDLYYISKGDWDANDDGVYGRFRDDMDAVDYGNDGVSIGRIPIRTAKDVEAYTAKVVAYESKYPTGAFATRLVYTCPEPGAYPKLNTSITAVGAAWASGDAQRFFASESPWDADADGEYVLSPAHWVEMLNGERASKLHMHGHGFNNLWVLADRQKITAATVGELTNENAYPVITTVSCWTGEYDSPKDPSITESMLRRAGGGAIAIVAPSREGIPVFHQRSDMRLMMTEGKMDGTTETLTHFWSHALTESATLGEAFQAAKSAMETDARKTAGFHFVQCELNLLGDPSLPPRAVPPTGIAGEVAVTEGRVMVSGVAGCDLCVWDGEDRYRLIRADDDGRVTFQKPSSQGWSVSAFAPNRNTWLHVADGK